MNARFWSVLSALLLGAVAYAQSGPASLSTPKVAILELDLEKGIKNKVIASDDFKRLGAEELSTKPIPGERPSNLIALFSCAGVDADCLKQIAGSLKVRFVLYGSLSAIGTNEKFSVSLFDAETAQILSSQQATFLFENRSAEMQKTIRKALAVKGAESIRIAAPMKPSNEAQPPAKGLWRFAVPVALAPGIAIFGLQAQSKKNAASGIPNPADPNDVEGAISIEENKVVLRNAVASDVFIVATLGSATWALLSYKKNNKKTAEKTAANP